jgi:para-nitrobenzyl esterase
LNTIATTVGGKVEGRVKEGVVLFAGIPYAKPPVGKLRFKAPQRHDPWEGVRPAQRFGPAAPQLQGEGLTDTAPMLWNEDCLTLSVCTPAVDDGRRPVLAWIHGGRYRTGQCGIPWYNGARFAANGDIIVVSFNYRLGALGFAHLARFGHEYAASGLNGTLDQVAALEWVRDNIAAFGGDPDNVTVAGESAGAMSVATLLGLPRAAGLFHRAILESGAAHHTLPLEAAEKVTELFCEALRVRSADDLHAVAVEDILNAQARIDAELGQGSGLVNRLGVSALPFSPAVEGSLLPMTPLEAIRRGASADIPVLIGTNQDETTLWAPRPSGDVGAVAVVVGETTGWGYGEVDEQRLGKIVTRLGGDDGMITTYRASRPDTSPDDLLVAITTDHMFRIPAIRLAEARADHAAPTWMYLFAWKSRAFGGRLRASHALEVPFAFNNLDRPGVDVFLGEGPTPQHVAEAMHGAWTSFIRTGNPNCRALPDWPPYDTERRATMVFDDTSAVIDDPGGAERRLWDGRR